MRRLDIRGVIQPFSFLIISKAFKEIREGETLEVMLNGPNAVSDLFKILPPSSYAMLLLEACQGNDDGVRLQLRKISARQRATDSPCIENPTLHNQRRIK